MLPTCLARKIKRFVEIGTRNRFSDENAKIDKYLIIDLMMFTYNVRKIF